MRRLPRVFCALLFVLGACTEHEQTPGRLSGTVVKVFDGDSMVVTTAGGEVEVRLGGIDAPEKDQPHSEVARDALEDLVLSRQISIHVLDVDQYDRIVGRVYRTKDELNINRTLVGEGHAWVYRRYAQDPELAGLEEDARKERLGLWDAPSDSIVPPWTWRKTHPRRN